jgi:two-component system, cell cycle sensor histidine kinase and response regulator CckA
MEGHGDDAELRFSHFVRANHVAIREQDVETGRTWCDYQFYSIFGYPADTEITHQTWADAVHPDDLRRMTDNGELSFEIKRPTSVLEYRFRRGDGSYAAVIDSVVVLYDEKGKAVRMTGAMRDVTAERAALAALEKSEERYRTRIEQAADAIYVIDEAGNFLEANCKTHEMLGYKTGEQIELNIRDVIPPEDWTEFEAALEAAMAGRTILDECRYVRKDGFIVAAENSVKLVAPGTIQVIARDITERKEAQRALQESECRHRTLIETATEGIWLGDPDCNTVLVNDRLAEMLGCTVAELQGARATDLIFPDDLPLFNEKKSNPGSTGLDLRVVRKDGSLLWVQVSSRPVWREDGESGGQLAMLTDVTERRRAEERLKATTERLETIFRSAPMGICLFDHEGYFVETNPAFQAMMGYSSSELKSLKLADHTHPEDIGRCSELFTELTSGQRDRYDLEKRYLRKNGTPIWVHLIVSTLNTASSGFAAIGWVEDITGRKRAFDEWQRSEARLRSLVESNVIGIFIADHDGGVSFPNDAFLRIVGYTREELPDLDWRKLTPSEFKDTDDTWVRELIAKGAAKPYEKQYIRKDGSRVAVLVGGEQHEENKVIAFVLELTELKEAQREVARLARIVESTDVAIISVSLDGRILSWNQGAERLYGYRASEAVGQPESIIIPNGRDKEYENLRDALLSDRSMIGRYQTIRLTKSKEPKSVSIAISTLRDEAGNVVGWSKIAHDLTHAKRAEQLEEQFRQAQKLEAVGRLAGGVAHDFNNLLMVISSYTEMMEARLEPDHRLRNNTREVLKATEKAAALTQQLLAFSRKQVLLPQIIDLNVIVEETTKMSKRLIGEDIEVSFLPSKDLWAIQADPGQITQILLNLYVNARDAMPTGGKLTITTRNVVVDSVSASHQHPSFLAGSYAVLTVSDNGAGMTEEIKERIFEPFFTTKASKGTGLGLSTVYGIVKQSGGYIWVQSAPGEGSRFELFFPQVAQPVTGSASPFAIGSCAEGQGETILVVEDENSLRVSVCEYLEEHGYSVLQAQNGEQALDISGGHSGPIHVLLTDVIMPKISGVELSKRLRDRDEMITMYMSGYTDDAIANQGVLQAGVSLIHKPFPLSELARKLREVLDGRAKEGKPATAAASYWCTSTTDRP